MNQRKLRIGFIGAGNMGQMAHLRHYANLPDCHVCALFEPRPQLALKVAARYGIETIYETPSAMMENADLDGVVVPQPFDRHGQIVTPLYEYSVPILTEKPLASSITVGERMVTALEKSSTFHMVGNHKRSDLATQWVVQEIARLENTRELGALRYIRITMPPGDWLAGGFDELLSSDETPATAFLMSADPRPDDLSDQEFQQYANFVNYYIHQINLLRYLLGEDYRVTFADKSGVLLVAESASGVTATIEMAPYSTALGWEENILIGFEKGYIKLSLPSPLSLNQAGEVEVLHPSEDHSPQIYRPIFAPEGAMRSQAKNFLRAIRKEIAPPCEAREALQDLRVARDYLRLHLRQ
jgi:predicted dehydrogenase